MSSLAGATGVDLAVQSGKFPAQVLIERLGLTPAETPQLVAEARAAYDSDDEVAAAAERLAADAAKEGPVFGGLQAEAVHPADQQTDTPE